MRVTSLFTPHKNETKVVLESFLILCGVPKGCLLDKGFAIA